jgi:hypothetical protein
MTKVSMYHKCPFTFQWCDMKNDECEALKYIVDCQRDIFDEQEAIRMVESCVYRRAPAEKYGINCN